MTHRAVAWVFVLLGLLALVGLGLYLFLVGLDQADKLGSVISAFVGLVNLGVALIAWKWNDSTSINRNGIVAHIRDSWNVQVGNKNHQYNPFDAPNIKEE